jgi:arylsulfatase A-like enzyme
MFTGLLPSEHGAHFQTMAYAGSRPTIAELARAEGYETEVATRNSLFDGSVPGATRGFDTITQLLRPLPLRGRLFHFLLALARPRVRRMLRESGFFTRFQRSRRDFVETVARMGLPNDRAVLEHAATRLREADRRGRPCFLFLNCYDVHAPYCPNESSPLQDWKSPAGFAENFRLTVALPRVSGHGYLRPGFRLSEKNRRMLRCRYETAIALMDRKLESFWESLAATRLLDDTVVVLVSDHGEAFGDHGLYLHDASVYETHLHVPLWIHHPEAAPGIVDDVVSTRSLFDLMRCVVQDRPLAGTLLDAVQREKEPIALAEHFHHPHVDGALPIYRQNQAAAIAGRYKMAVRGNETRFFDLLTDPDEERPIPASLPDFTSQLRDAHVPPRSVSDAFDHLRRGSRVAGATSAGAGVGRGAM